MLKFTKAFASFSVDDVEKAKIFYGQVLGLEVSQTKEGLNLLLPGGSEVFIYPKGAGHVPATYTVLNFLVSDIEETVNDLTNSGISFESYNTEYMKTDEKGIARGNGHGPNIAWFKDPAGNFLSIIEDSK